MTVYLLAGGGTAGHVNPLLALADYITQREPESKVLVLGTSEGLEARLVPERGYDLKTIARLPFPRKPGIYALKFPFMLRRAIRDVKNLIAKEDVDVVVGFGGYASAPAYSAAKAAGVPYVIHEANAKPGLANRQGARSTPYVGVTFSNTKIKNARFTGMPLRPEIENLDLQREREGAREHFGLEPDRVTLLVTGGSLGAKAINEAVSACAQQIVASGAQVLHVWGGLTEMQDPGVPSYHVIKYCDRMDLALAAADLVVSRAGSATVSEISGLGIPAVFAPYGHGNGEQRYNARDVVEAGGALMFSDAELTEPLITGTVLPLLHSPEKLEEMAERSRSVGTLEGSRLLYELVQESLGTSGA